MQSSTSRCILLGVFRLQFDKGSNRRLEDNILLFANPGEVFYRAGENAAAVPIWTGEKGVDPDLNYCSLPAFVTNPTCAASISPTSNMGAAGRPFYVGRSRKNDAACEVEDAYVQLKLEPVHSSNADDNVVLPQSNLMMFSYTPKNHVSYTIKEFSATRFGSHRQRPDHDVMKRIQRQAANRGNTARAHALEAGDGPELKATSISSRPMFTRTSPIKPGDTTNPIAAISMVPRRNNGKRRSANSHNSSWLT
ncbi:hypothetical protein TELCIR_07606 [Teladorsagia circumcincta]|uniref:Uncharacterized protein n=1 Tax=Teladorsagia circumcincta TaxID=45464 RepID=A0A2G9UJW2_TELCI|nr:hypothetical protein TELCIR_07606 [Teladorsagia circumcincta]